MQAIGEALLGKCILREGNDISVGGANQQDMSQVTTKRNGKRMPGKGAVQECT
jgi:hypothetical protein